MMAPAVAHAGGPSADAEEKTLPGVANETCSGRIALGLVSLLGALLAAGPATGQAVDRPAQERLPLPDFEEPEEERPQLLPPLAPPEPAAPGLPGGPRFFVRSYRIFGNSVFTAEDFQPVLDPYLGREISSEELVALRNAITRLYVDHGYLNSGAVIPDQDLEDGVVEVRIIEGSLIEIEVSGTERFRPGWLRKRVALGAATPLDVKALEESLEILQQDPRIRRVNARLLPGERPGEAVLQVSVEEERPYRLDLEANSFAPPAFGGYQGQLLAAHENLLGFGDTLGFRFRGAEGLLRLDGQYEFPLDARGTQLLLRGEWSTTEIVEDSLAPLGIETDYVAGRIGIEHPVYRSLGTTVTLGLLADWRRATTCGFADLVGFCDPLSAPSSGAVRGRTTVSVLRLTQNLLRRDRNQVIAARSMFSLGLPILGARSGGVDPDGQFFAWLGQFQWARRYGSWGVQTIFRTDVQLSNDTLPSLERFPIGGHLSVRGYRENQLVRDQGVVASLEVRVPVWKHEGGRPLVELAPFFDVGYSKARELSTPPPDTLPSVGIGLRLTPLRNLSAQLYWGYQIQKVRSSGDIQDDGIQFRVTWNAF
jgi:hemolysin activation/secretion protein